MLPGYIRTYIYIYIYIYIYYTCTKTDDIYKDVVEVVETRFDTSNYELDSPLPKGKNKILMGLMKDELGEKIIVEFVGLTPETYSYLINEG